MLPPEVLGDIRKVREIAKYCKISIEEVVNTVIAINDYRDKDEIDYMIAIKEFAEEMDKN